MIVSIISLAVFFLILCSGSALFCTLEIGKFEDGLPITCVSIVCIEFIFGIAGFLLPGFFVAFAVAVIALGVAMILAIRKEFRAFARRFFTPGFFLFTVMYVILFVLNYGMRLRAWDEFSHWGDIVKVMTTLHSFGTHPLSESWFPNYPPAMALFQFFCEEIYIHISRENMVEWLLFFSYQVFLFSMYFPFLKRLNLKKVSGWVVIAVIWLIPMIFQNNAYGKIYIDSFLSTLLGTGFTYVFLEREPDTAGKLNLAVILFLLPITKSIGLPFAAVLLIALYVLEDRGKRVYTVITLAPWVVWQIYLKVTHAVKMVGASSGIAAEHIGDSHYVFGILKDYLAAMVRRPVTDADAIFPQLPPLVVLLLLMLVLWLLLQKERKSFVIIFAANILFFMGMGVSFMYFFPEIEALELLGIERYLNNMLMADAILALLLLLDLMNRCVVLEKKVTAAVLVTALLFTPVRPAARFVLRREVAAAQSLHSRYAPYYDTLAEQTKGKTCSILFATDGSDLLDFMLLRTELRPNHVEMHNYPDNIEKFDYVVMYHLDTPPENTENGGIYAVNGNKLIRVN